MGLFTFEITDSHLNIRLANLKLRSFALSDIEEAKEGYTFWNEHWCNPAPLQFVTLRRKTGFIKNLVINPPDRRRFLTDIQSKISQ